MFNKRISLFLAFFLLIAASISFGGGSDRVINRVIAAVNDDIITLYEARLAARWNGTEWDTLGISDKGKLTAQMVNRLLVLQEINKSGRLVIPDDQIRDGIRRIKESNSSLNFTDNEIEEFVKGQLLIGIFARERFMPLVQVTDEMVRRYYNEDFRQEYSGGNKQIPLSAEVSRGIRTILEERETTILLQNWLEKQHETNIITIKTLE